MRKSSGNTISEMPVVLIILSLMAVFPLIDFISLTIGAITTAMFVHQAATAAAVQETFQGALSAIDRESQQFAYSGFARLNKQVAVGGFNGTGVDLRITATDFRSNDIKVYPANTSLPTPPDPLSHVYEYSCTGTYQMGPFVSLASLPFIGDVPGLGKPFVFSYTAHRAIEHTKGLEGAPQQLVGFTPNADGSVGNLGPSNSTTPGTDPMNGDWNFPNIYQLIAAAGQTVVSSNILQVPADKADWTDTGLTVGPNQMLWMDSQATGLWGNAVTGSSGWDKDLDANGSTGEQTAAGGDSALPGQGRFLMAGRLGSNTAFVVGKSLQNYALNQTGPLLLNCNDDSMWRSQDSGIQTVRVIITTKI